MKSITSGQNPYYKQAKQLNSRKQREENGLFLVEGVRFLDEAIASKANIERIFISETFLEGCSRAYLDVLEGFELNLLPDRLFKELADTETPQGAAAVVKRQRLELDKVLGGRNLYVILEAIQDPGNLGTIIRTADAAGFTGVLVSKGCADVYSPKVLRATMGSIFHIPVVGVTDMRGAMTGLRAGGVKLLAAHLRGDVSYYQVDMKQNIALLVGSEANGLSEETAALADELVKIPMPGLAESLNASVAAGLLLFESVRQRAIPPER